MARIFDRFQWHFFFMYEEKVTNESLQLYTDAAASLGYGACFQNNCFWSFSKGIV